MMRLLVGMMLAALVSTTAVGQTTEPRPTFEVADVHATPQGVTSFFRTSIRGERYEVRNANMVDLIRTAYGVGADKVLDGPNWLEFNRFDVTARVPRNTSQETIRLMLQSLLADRFKLVVHNDTKPVMGFVLSAGKSKPKLKEADPSGKTGCQQQQAPPPPPTPGQLSVPMIAVSCHNITMEAFAAELKGAAGGGYVTNAVVDSTALKGSWDFDFKFTIKPLLQLVGSNGVTLPDAIDKQLGLKLEEQKLPTAVIVVDQVETPSANPPDLAQKLPPPPPAEFEVADIKPTNTSVPPQSIIAGGIGVLPGGRVNLPGMFFPLKQLITVAWNLNSNEDIAGAPKWLDSTRFDIVAKVPADFMSANGAIPPMQDLAPMLQALLIDRFKMKNHFEDQLVTAYTLVTAKPKLKKADPSTRTGCKTSTSPIAPPSDGFPTLPSRMMTCQNMTMAQLADQLQSIAGPYVHYPVVDATGLEGGWDFSFTFSPIPASQLAGLRGANPFGGNGGGGGPTASDPVGGNSLFDAFEKQLGLKLEAQKRQYPVFVIDHIEEKPTDN